MKVAAGTLNKDRARPREEQFNCTIPDGMVGFPKSTEYTVKSGPEIEPFLKMSSRDEAGVQFVLVDPWLVKPDYRFEMSDQDVEKLGLPDPSRMMTLSVVTIHREDQGISLNLAAPVVINLDRMTGAQLILEDEKHPLRHFVKTD